MSHDGCLKYRSGYIHMYIIILILHLSEMSVRAGGHGKPFDPSLKRFLSLHQWTWSRYEVVH